MAVVLRLARAGAKKMPYYHVVATDSRNPRDGKFIEAIGAYDPNLEPPKVEFKQERLEHWLKAGAHALRDRGRADQARQQGHRR